MPAGGHRRQTAKSASQAQPNSLQTLCPPMAHKNKMRPAMPAQRQNTSTLRRSGCFGFGRFGAPQHCRCVAAGTKLPPLKGYSGPAGGPARQRPAASPAKPTQAPSRPYQKPSARPCTSPSGMSAACAASPRCGYGVRPPCVKMPQAAPAASFVRTEPRGSDGDSVLK